MVLFDILLPNDLASFPVIKEARNAINTKNVVHLIPPPVEHGAVPTAINIIPIIIILLGIIDGSSDASNTVNPVVPCIDTVRNNASK